MISPIGLRTSNEAKPRPWWNVDLVKPTQHVGFLLDGCALPTKELLLERVSSEYLASWRDNLHGVCLAYRAICNLIDCGHRPAASDFKYLGDCEIIGHGLQPNEAVEKPAAILLA